MKIEIYRCQCQRCFVEFWEIDDEVKICPSCGHSTFHYDDVIDVGKSVIELKFENHKNQYVLKILTDQDFDIDVRKMQ